jgi:hypothetical protein
MDEARAATELAELVEDFFAHGRPDAIAVASLCEGVSQVEGALQELRDCTKRWGHVLALLRTGTEHLDAGLALARSSGCDAPSLLADAERHARFARVLIDEIERQQAGESTLA